MLYLKAKGKLVAVEVGIEVVNLPHDCPLKCLDVMSGIFGAV